MSGLASAFKSEIIRLSKKQNRQDLTPLRKTVTAQRAAIAALKRDVSSLKKELARVVRTTPKAAPKASEKSTLRFNPKGMATHRKRLGLSAAEYAKLAGVSAQTIYNWEHRKAKPRASQLATLAGLRKLGKREARAKLAGA
jgi:DNA-binding transcriptional regulator YiaG